MPDTLGFDTIRLKSSITWIAHYPIMDFMAQMVQAEMIGAQDFTLLFLTDSIEEAAQHIQTYDIENFDWYKRTVPRRSRFLWE
jgi:hypothetical protein